MLGWCSWPFLLLDNFICLLPTHSHTSTTLLVATIMTPYPCLQRICSKVLRPHTHQHMGVCSELKSGPPPMECRLGSIPQDLSQPFVFMCSQSESPKNSNTCAFKATPRDCLQPSLKIVCQWIAPASWYNIVMATSSIRKPEQCWYHDLFVRIQATHTLGGALLLNSTNTHSRSSLCTGVLVFWVLTHHD